MTTAAKKDPGKIWFCKRCSVVEDDETRYARHLRTHINGYRKFPRKLPPKKCAPVPVRKVINETRHNSLTIIDDDPPDIVIPKNITDLLRSSILNEDICQRLVDPASVMPSKISDVDSFNLQDFLFSNDSPVKSLPGPDAELNLNDSIMDIPLVQKNDLSIFDSQNNITYQLIIANDSQPQTPPPKRVDKTDDSKNKYVCEICQMKFSQEFYLRRHLSKHARDYVCEGCSYSFSRRETLMTHRCEELTKILSADDNVIDPDENVLNSDIDPPSQMKFKKKRLTRKQRKALKYKCFTCGIVFNHQFKLKSHQIIHDKMKYYVCVYCDAVVKHRYSLIRHLRKTHLEYQHEWNTEKFIDNVCCKNNIKTKRSPRTKNGKLLESQLLANSKIPITKIVKKPQIKPIICAKRETKSDQSEKTCDKVASSKICFRDSFINLGITEDSVVNDLKLPPVISKVPPNCIFADSNDTMSSYTKHFHEDIGQVSFPALPDSICKALDSKENSPMKGLIPSITFPPILKTPEKTSILVKMPVIPLLEQNIPKSPTADTFKDLHDEKTEFKETWTEAKEISITDETLINDAWFEQLDSIMNETEIQQNNMNILSNENAEALENIVHLIADKWQN